MCSLDTPTKDIRQYSYCVVSENIHTSPQERCSLWEFRFIFIPITPKIAIHLMKSLYGTGKNAAKFFSLRTLIAFVFGTVLAQSFNKTLNSKNTEPAWTTIKAMQVKDWNDVTSPILPFAQSCYKQCSL